ncbi:MAG: serine/threonine protein kinase, partial [Chloroflexi bacterium]|nr:serine/threonine protein kinase [Chloroflexota bacterium]
MQTILPVGSTVQERYVVEDLLGKGGFGAVYLVRDQRVKGNLYALKEVIAPNKEERARFTFEGEVLKRLDHPGLPRVYRTFQDDKHARAYMLMDYIEGPNLEILRHQQPGNRFPFSQAMSVMAPIFDAVGYLHKQRPPIIHRDVKPANIIVPPGGEGSVLVDFGIAKEYDQEGTTTAVRRCSPGYGAPEQYARGTNPRTDIYGLGATFYALVTGQVPPDALYRMTQLGSQQPDPLLTEPTPPMPEHVTEALHRAMAINSNDRFASVAEFWQALNALPVKNEAPAPVLAPTPIVRQRQGASPVAPDIATAPIVANYRQKNPPSRRRQGAFLLLFTAIALLALVIGSVFGMGLFLGIANSGHQAAKTTSASTPNATVTTTTSAAVTPSARAATTPTPVPPSPSAAASHYPQLANSYQGSIVDKLTNPATSSTMSLSQVKQNGKNISGQFTVGSGLIGSGAFTGTVTADNKIQFTVA